MSSRFISLDHSCGLRKPGARFSNRLLEWSYHFFSGDLPGRRIEASSPVRQARTVWAPGKVETGENRFWYIFFDARQISSIILTNKSVHTKIIDTLVFAYFYFILSLWGNAHGCSYSTSRLDICLKCLLCSVWLPHCASRLKDEEGILGVSTP